MLKKYQNRTADRIVAPAQAGQVCCPASVVHAPPALCSNRSHPRTLQCPRYLNLLYVLCCFRNWIICQYAPTANTGMGVQKRRNREGLLDADGVCAPGEVAAPNDILVNRQTPLNTKDVVPGMGHGDAALGDADYKPTPLAWKGPPGQNVVVDKVLLTNNEEGHMVVKARPPPLLKVCELPVCMQGCSAHVCAGACNVFNMKCNALFTLVKHSLDSAHEQGLTVSRFSTSLSAHRC